MNNKNFFIVIFILCLSFLMYSCESTQEIQENTVTQRDSTEIEILPTNTLDEKIIYTATSSTTPTSISTFTTTPTPTLTSTVIPSTTPTPTEVWRSSVVVEKFDLLRDERVENRLPYARGIYTLSPDRKFALLFVSEDMAELWRFDGEEIATYIGTYINVITGKFSPDSSKFALLGEDEVLRIYDLNGFEISSYKNILFDITEYGTLRTTPYYFSKNGNYILIINNYEGLGIYKTTGQIIPNYNYISYSDLSEIDGIKSDYSKSSSFALTDSIAFEKMKQLRHETTSGELIEIILSDKEDKFNIENYLLKVSDSGYKYYKYDSPILNFSYNEKYALFIDRKQNNILIWSFEELAIINEIQLDFLNQAWENDIFNNDLYKYLLRNIKITSINDQNFLSYLSKNGVEIFNIETGEKIYLAHDDITEITMFNSYLILEKVNRIITFSYGHLKIWSLDGKLINSIEDTYRIGRFEKISPNQDKLVFVNCFNQNVVDCNLSVISSLDGRSLITFSDSSLKPVFEDGDYLKKNVSLKNHDLIEYVSKDGIYPTIYLNEQDDTRYYWFSADSNLFSFGGSWNDSKPIIFDFEKNEIIDILPIESLWGIESDIENDYLIVSGEWYFDKETAEWSVTIWDQDGYLLGVLPSNKNNVIEGYSLGNGKILTETSDQYSILTVWRTLDGYPYDWRGTEGLDLSNYPYPLVTPTATFTMTPRSTYTPTVTLTSTPTLTPSISPTPTMTLEFTLTPTVVPTETPRPTITPRAFGIEISESTHQYLHYQPNTVINFDYVINKTALSNDGKHVAVYTFDDDGFGNNDYHMVEVYDLAGSLELSFDWKGRYEEKGYDPMLKALSFSPDDSMLLLADETGKIRLIDMDGNLISIINLQKSSCNVENLAFYFCEDINLKNELDFDPYGTCNASIDKTELYKAWAVIDVGFKAAYLEEPEYICPAFEGLEIEAVFSPNGKLIATLLDNVVTVWDLHGNKLYEYENYIISLSQLSFSPDSKYLLFTEERKAYLWDFEKDEIVEKFDVDDAIMNIEFVEDLEDFDLSINDDRNAERKAIEDFWFDEKNTSAEFVKVDYYDLVRPRYGVQIETQYSQVYVFDIEFDEDLHFGWGKGIIVYDAIFAPKQDLLVTEYASGVLIWKDGLEEYVYNFHNPGYNTVMLKLHENERWLAMATWNDVVKIWDIKTGVLMSTLEFHDGPIKYVEFLEDTDQIITSSYDHRVVIWDHVKR